MVKAQIRCHRLLREHPEWDAKMVLQVHDELVFDFPKRGDPVKHGIKGTNLPKVRMFQQAMERGGGDIGVRTPVSVEYHPENWEMGISM
jgi:hypothetical protein